MKLPSVFSGLTASCLAVARKPLSGKDLLATLQPQIFSGPLVLIYSTAFPPRMLSLLIPSGCSYNLCQFPCSVSTPPNQWYRVHIVFKFSSSFALFTTLLKRAFLLNWYLSPKSWTVLYWHKQEWWKVKGALGPWGLTMRILYCTVQKTLIDETAFTEKRNLGLMTCFSRDTSIYFKNKNKLSSLRNLVC